MGADVGSEIVWGLLFLLLALIVVSFIFTHLRDRYK
jgi:hypothetical protein